MTKDPVADLLAETRRLRLCRDRWRNRCYVSCALAFAMLVGVAAYCIGARQSAVAVPTSQKIETKSEYTPNQILAAVRIGGGSGIVWAKGQKRSAIVSAAHCYEHNAIGDQLTAGNVKGKEFKVTLRAVDFERDLAFLTMPSECVVGVANIIEQLPPYGSDKQAVGFPLTRGPIFKHLENEVQTTGDKWVCTVKDGQFWAGDSGGGMFLCGIADDPDQDGLLAGIIHAQEARKNGPRPEDVERVNYGTANNPTGRYMYCVPHEHLLAFCKRQCKRGDWDCGNGFCRPRQQQQPQPRGSAPAPNPNGKPNWLTPNVPIVVPPAPAPVPPPDNAPAPAPEPAPPAPAPPASKPAPKGKPQANSTPPAPYDGTGRPPAGLRTKRQRSHWISELLQQMGVGGGQDLTALQQQVAALTQQVQALQSGQGSGNGNGPAPAPAPGAPGIAGKNGVDGKDGAAGKDGIAGPAGAPGPAGTVTVIYKDAATGTVIQQANNVVSGSTVTLTKKHFAVPPTK